MTHTSRRVTRGAVTPLPRGRPEPTQLIVADQPEVSHRDLEQVMARRKRVIEPRLNKAIDALRLLQEAGNKELYGFSTGEKQQILNVIGREVAELRKALEHGTRGSRYITIEELSGEEY